MKRTTDRSWPLAGRTATRPWQRLLVGVLALVVTGCQVPRTMANVGLDQPPTRVAAAEPASVPTTLRGRVGAFPHAADQALPGDVLGASTVSLIDSNGQTQASTVTDSAGAFTLALGSYSPSTSPGLYYLEAVHGLGGTLPGNQVGRFRTVLQWNGAGWLSCTNAAVGGTILINQYTTALAIEKALDGTIPLANLINKVSTANPSALNANPTVTGHSDAEINALAVDLMASLQANLDPIGKVPSVLPSVSAFAPTSAAANAIIAISGSGFSPTGSGNTVWFTGAAQPATILLATPTQLVVVVPSSAQTGPVTVSTGRGQASSTATFTVLATSGTTIGIYVNTLAPSEGRPGTTITLTGDFGSGTATPDVYFPAPPGYSGVVAPVTAWNATTVVCTVPYGTQSGPLTVKVGKQSVVTPDWFTFWTGDITHFDLLSQSSYGYAYTTPWNQYGYATATASVGGKLYYYQIGGYSSDYSYVRVYPVSSVTNNVDNPRACSRLQTGRYYAGAAVVGSWLFVFGGLNSGGVYLGDIEKARILPDGSLGPWSPANTMASPRARMAVVVRTATNYMYVLGGLGPAELNTWEMWKVTDLANGVISRTNTGTIYNGGTAVTARDCSAVLSGTGIFLHVGYSAGAWSKVCLSIPIDTDDTLLAGTAQTLLTWCHGYGSMAVIGSDVYLFAGQGSNNTEHATFNFANATISSGWISAGIPATLAAINYTYGPPLVTPNNVVWFCGASGIAAQIMCGYVEADKSIKYWHYWGRTRHGWYASIWQTIGRNIWRFGGYDQDLSIDNPITEYYSVEDDGTIGPAITGPQLNYGRRAPFYGRSTGLATNYMYLIGGYCNSPAGYRVDSERVAIDDTTGLTTGNWQFMPNVNLYRGSYWGASMVIGKYLYCFGGYDAQFTSGSKAIQRATINPDGSLSDFEMLPQQLPWLFYETPAVRVKDYIYLTNGYWNGSISPRVVRARIYPNGDIGQFFWDGTTTDQWGVYSPAVNVLGNYLYQFGGYNYYTTNGGYTYYYANWALRASINPDGTLGAWSNWQPTGWYPQIGSNLYNFHTSAPTYKDHIYLMSGSGNGSNIIHATFR